MKTKANDPVQGGRYTVTEFTQGGSSTGPKEFLGLTKRELLAAHALTGLIASCLNTYPGRQETAKRALEYADALIEELNKEKP